MPIVKTRREEGEPPARKRAFAAIVAAVLLLLLLDVYLTMRRPSKAPDGAKDTVREQEDQPGRTVAPDIAPAVIAPAPVIAAVPDSPEGVPASVRDRTNQPPRLGLPPAELDKHLQEQAAVLRQEFMENVNAESRLTLKPDEIEQLVKDKAVIF